MKNVIVSKDFKNPTIIHVKGDVNAQNCKDFLEQMYSAVLDSKESICIDCQELNSIDGNGLGAFLNLRTTLVKMRLCNVSGQPGKMLQTLAITKFFVKN